MPTKVKRKRNFGSCTFCLATNVSSRHFSSVHGVWISHHAQSNGLIANRTGLGSKYICIHCHESFIGPFQMMDHLGIWHKDKIGTIKGVPPEPAPVADQGPLVVGDTDTAQIIETLHQALNDRDTTIESLQSVIAKLEAAVRHAEDARAKPVPLSNGASDRIMGILRHLRP